MVLGKIKYVKKSDSEKYCEGKMKRIGVTPKVKKNKKSLSYKIARATFVVIVCLLYEESATYLLMRAYKAK